MLEHPRTGEQLTFVVDTPDELVIVSLWRPRGGRAVEHLHPGMEERYEVLAGMLMLRVDGVEHELGPGASLAVAPGVVHMGWNPLDRPLQLRIEMVPPLRYAEYTRRYMAGEQPRTLLPEYAAELVVPGFPVDPAPPVEIG